MKSDRDRLHSKLVMYRVLIIYRLNTQILGDLYRFFHVEKGALITDHVEYKLPITFHGGTQSRFTQKKRYKSQFTLKISSQSRFTWLTLVKVFEVVV